MSTTAEHHVREQIARVEALPHNIQRTLFVEFSPERIIETARRQDQRKAQGESLPLHGVSIAIKDLFDEHAQITTAASKLWKDNAPASRDSEAIRRLLAAGAVPFGRSTMSEFAYSGVGLNPHYGNPESALGHGLISGGSTSGGAVCVGLGLCDAALGTDTGGSCRIPAAANALFGIKPTQSLISREGVMPLAESFDTVGVISDTSQRLRAILEVLAESPLADVPAKGALHLAIPQGAFTNDLSATQHRRFEVVCEHIKAAGHRLTPLDLSALNDAAWANRALVSHEALGIYREHLDTLSRIGDPYVLSRIRFALDLSVDDIAEARNTRTRAMAMFSDQLEGFDALICPTLASELPTIEAVAADFDTLNPRMLRNPSLINLADGCALARPVSVGGAPFSLMIAAPKGADARLLAVDQALPLQV